MTLKVLVVDDEPQARRVMRVALTTQGFEVNDGSSGEEALAKLRDQPPDVVLMDLKMPGMGGFEACRKIRERSETPIIVVSGSRSTRDRTEAFEAGADQYIVKPCEIPELVARIRAVKRRSDARASVVLALGDVEVNFRTHEVKRSDGTVHLTAKEFVLLECLVAHANQVVSHRRILQAVWGPDYGDEIEYLRVSINQLRKKIEPDPANPAYILTEPRTGYRLAVPLKRSDIKPATVG